MIDTKKLEAFATSSRTALIAEVTARLNGILAPASTARIEAPAAVKALEDDIRRHGGDAAGKQHVAEQQAYVWFNRIIAFRYMDACGYTTTPVVSPEGGRSSGQPAVLAAAKRGEYDPDVFGNKGTVERVTGLLNGSIPSRNRDGEAYGLILGAYCAFWNRAMPFMFAPEGNYTGLLMPANLLAEGSVLSRAVTTLTADDCQDVEVIGWLYQYYISARKDEVFAGFAKGKKAGPDEIPAATQLFTPDWIVRYLVQNSVGRLWMLNHPKSKLIDQMEYYIAPVGEPGEFLKIDKPEDLTVMDPACGSGHMLTYAFDLLYAIYEEEGYSPSEIPGLILTNNLYGCEIDERAGALAAFALTMKARAKQRRFFTADVSPNICVLENIPGTEFAHADLFGSLIKPGETDLLTRSAASTVADSPQAALGFAGDLFTESERKLARQVGYLSRMYSVVVTNPPYMGGKNMDATLAEFAKDNYPITKSDLFAMFIERCLALATVGGQVAMITMQSWMFLSSYEKLRGWLLHQSTIETMAHLGARAFDSIGGEVVQSTAFVLVKGRANREGVFIRLVNSGNEAEKSSALRKAASNSSEVDRHQVFGSAFAAIPGTPIVYWLSEKMRAAFSMGKPLGEIAEPRQGLATTDNARFTRSWWEVGNARVGYGLTREEARQSALRWFPYNKGGEFRRWYGNQELLVCWQEDGAEVCQTIVCKYPYLNGKYQWVAKNMDTYFLPSVSWSKVSSGAPAFRLYPSGFVYDVAGTSIFALDAEALSGLLAFGDSQVAFELLVALAPTLNYEVGQISSLPVVPIKEEPTLEQVGHLVATSKDDWDSYETSWEFGGNLLVNEFRALTVR